MGIFTEIPSSFLDHDDTPTTYSGFKGKFPRVNVAEGELYFSPAIVGVTSSGIEPPDPEETNLWYNTDLHMFFYYDYGKDDWLSLAVNNYLFTYQGNCDGLYLSIGDLRHAGAHYLMPRTATITAIMASAEEIFNSSKSFEIHNWGTLITGGTFTLTNYEYFTMDANIRLDEGTRLQVFCTMDGDKCRNPGINFEIRWRYAIP